MKKEIKKFPYVANLDELKSIGATNGGFVSDQAAAKLLFVTRAYVLQLEKRGEIHGYRLRANSNVEDDSRDHIFVEVESVKAYTARKTAKAAATAANQAAAAAAAAPVAVAAGVE